MKRLALLVLFEISAFVCPIYAQTKCEANIGGFKFNNVYIMGDHYSAVVWAYKHIAEETCLTPVQDIAKADAILELYSTDVPRSQPHDATQVSVVCSSNSNTSTCTDSDGNLMTTSCNANGCSSYYGPDPAHEIGQAISSWIANASYQGEARIFTVDHKLLWRSTDQKGATLWSDKIRLGTNSPGCEGRNWSVMKDARKYKNYRGWASEKCGIEMPSFVSIDLKLQSKQDAAAAKEQEKQQMIENAKDAAAKQSK